METVGDGAQVEAHIRKEGGHIAPDSAKIVLDAHINDFDEFAFIIIDQDVGRADSATTDVEAIVCGRRGVGDFGL